MDKSAWNKYAAKIMIGVAVGICILLIGSGVGAWLIASEKIAESAIPYTATVIEVITWGTACLISVALSPDRKLIVSLITAAVLLAVQLIISMLFLEGEVSGLASVFVIATVIGAGVGILSNKPRKKKSFPKRK